MDLKNLNPYIADTIYLTQNIKEITIYAPLQAKAFKPGQFFRLQNYERSNLKPFEPIALTGSSVKGNLLSFAVLDSGKSSKLCFELKKNDPVILLGPSGRPTFIPKNENVVLIAGGVGNATILPIAKAMKENNCNITYFAGFKNKYSIIKKNEILNSADNVIFCLEEYEEQEETEIFKGNLVDALNKFNKFLCEAKKVYVIGSIGLLKALQGKLNKLSHIDTIASINSPMGCMMKEICGKCLQSDKEGNFVYSCSNQEQLLCKTDLDVLEARLAQNRLMERLL